MGWSNFTQYISDKLQGHVLQLICTMQANSQLGATNHQDKLLDLYINSSDKLNHGLKCTSDINFAGKQRKLYGHYGDVQFCNFKSV